MKLPDLGIRSLFSGERPDIAASLGTALFGGLILLIFFLVLPEILQSLSRHQLPESSSKIPVTGGLLILAGPVAAQASPEQPASLPFSLPSEASSDPAAAPEALSSLSDSVPASPPLPPAHSSSQTPSSSPTPQKPISQESVRESPAPKPRPVTPSRPRKASGPSAVTPRRERQGEAASRSELSDKKKNGSGFPEKSVTSAAGSPAAPAEPSREPLRQDAGRAAREGHLKGAGLIRREIERLKRYPPRALRNGIEGSGAILADVSASGRVSGARVSKKTGNRFLDGSLEEVAAGIVGFDTGIPGEPYRTEIPVRYLISPR
ncbi:TonB family protein [Succinimonas sp.]|uniref:TonB family protein n=1 Tax=Succinimonas sp. TaxID=1936151 RepID=UPI00386DBC59